MNSQFIYTFTPHQPYCGIFFNTGKVNRTDGQYSTIFFQACITASILERIGHKQCIYGTSDTTLQNFLRRSTTRSMITNERFLASLVCARLSRRAKSPNKFSEYRSDSHMTGRISEVNWIPHTVHIRVQPAFTKRTEAIRTAKAHQTGAITTIAIS